MKNLNCPDCNNMVATKSEKTRIAFLGGSLVCEKCGAQLKVGGRFFTTLIGAAVGSVFLYVVLYSLAVNSWLPVIFVVILAWCLVSTVIYFSGFKRVGTKRFHI